MRHLAHIALYQHHHLRNSKLRIDNLTRLLFLSKQAEPLSQFPMPAFSKFLNTNCAHGTFLAMSNEKPLRTAADYDLVRFQRSHAQEQLASPSWYKSAIDKKILKHLMQRRDLPALRDTILLYGLLIGLAVTAVMLGPSWLGVPVWLAYGVLYASAADSRWHEAGHGTAFKTGWMNEIVYQIACFMIMRNPVTWKYSHARHHTDTLIVGRDPEIALMRPPRAIHTILNFFGIPDIIDAFKRMLVHLTGQLSADEATFIPQNKHQEAIFISRLWLLIYAGVITSCVLLQSWLPVLLIGGPRIYGSWHFNMTGLIQHGGLDDNVTDHRLNTRTVFMNPISRFIYLNMNYHVEHHMFPAVPYYNLPALHQLLKDDLPPPSLSIWDAYKEMLPILYRQLKGEAIYLERSWIAEQK